MENKMIKYLYYRGVRYISQIREKKEKIKEITYRGFRTIKESAMVSSGAIKIYRGVQY